MSSCSDPESNHNDGRSAVTDAATVTSSTEPSDKPATGAAVDCDGSAPSAPQSAAAVRPFTWRDLTGTLDSPQVCVRLGSLRLTGEQQRALRIGAVVRLDHSVDAPVEIMAGQHVLAYGHVVLAGGKLAVQVTTRRQPVRRQSA